MTPVEAVNVRPEGSAGLTETLLTLDAVGVTVVMAVEVQLRRDEQKRRLQERLLDPEKNWKFSEADLKERGLWKDYIDAFNIALTRCSTDHAPWWIVPANHKWFRDWMVARVLRHTLQGFDMQWPKAKFDVSKVKVD